MSDDKQGPNKRLELVVDQALLRQIVPKSVSYEMPISVDIRVGSLPVFTLRAERPLQSTELNPNSELQELLRQVRNEQDDQDKQRALHELLEQHLRGKQRWRHNAIEEADAVPPSAEKILSFVVSPGRLEEARGDLEQGFRRLYQLHGRPHAVRWYYWHVTGIAIGGVLKGLFRWRWVLLFLTSK